MRDASAVLAYVLCDSDLSSLLPGMPCVWPHNRGVSQTLLAGASTRRRLMRCARSARL